MRKVHFCYPTTSPINDWEHRFLPAIRRAFLNGRVRGYELVETADEADLVVMLESNTYKSHKHIEQLRNEPVVAQYPNKVFTINYEDEPAGFLPGLYASLPKQRFDPVRHRTWAYLFTPNDEADAKDKVDFTHCGEFVGISPLLLFSFRGADSHPVRSRIFAAPYPGQNHCVTRIERWYNHSVAEKAEYFHEILRSQFVLCPRGIGPSSHRLFEVMALGRCPVIISDEWVPPRGIDWNRCSVTIRERDIERVPQILNTMVAHARELGNTARNVWRANFSPEQKVRSALDVLWELRASRPANYNEHAYQRRWSTWRFYRQNGWSLDQRVARRLTRLARI
jgi:hypothetical protein